MVVLTTAAIYAASFALTGLFVRDITLKEFEEQRKTSDGDAGEVELTSSQGPSLSPLTAGTGTESESGPEIGKEMGAGAETALTRGGPSREQRQGRQEAAAVDRRRRFRVPVRYEMVVQGDEETDSEAVPAADQGSASAHASPGEGEGSSCPEELPADAHNAAQNAVPIALAPSVRPTASLWVFLKEIVLSKTFWRFCLLSLFLVNLRAIFRHLDATLPTYLMRSFGPSYPKGLIYSINPFIIILLTPIVAGQVAQCCNRNCAS